MKLTRTSKGVTIELSYEEAQDLLYDIDRTDKLLLFTETTREILSELDELIGESND